MWTEQLASAAPSPGALAAARALIDAIRVVASECVGAWVDAPADAADVAVEEVVRSNPALGFAHVLLPPVESREAVRRVVRDASRGLAPAGLSMVEHLAACIAPGASLVEQLGAALSSWSERLSPEVLERLLRARDALQEESTFRGPGPGPLEVPSFDAGPGDSSPSVGDEAEDEARFSEDREWMPSLVMIAKQTYVWLGQLSKTHRRPIATLDAIPDEELAVLAERGITGLWLIGLWKRSAGSAAIKRRMGNEEALASAYSLDEYVIAEDLGGEGALGRLRARAWAHGIRLAADMVPNHMGLDGRWVVERPDLFVQASEPPYDYSFTGPDLCVDPRAEIRIEDGYWTRSDAAVVFERRDAATGEARYIYHGNDGTSMPWNDTAQLDYLAPEVREAVLRTILDVARRFPIIRFDAAMTLARRHVRRLWHPPPGEGGAIPSRSRHAVSTEAFDSAMPREFWREVVERVQLECPDTLLLAEAFWMMEGYFVRTLGMHRVYNSAFMHMLRDEDGEGFRRLLREVLEYDPAVLARFVNFMNNPDEESAVSQFGRGDKYFGTATLLATLPGLPMFGHGQFEGFAEKYGMEFARAYQPEVVDTAVLLRHERAIVPLLRRRGLFTGVERFAMYDFVLDGGGVDPNVIAYSNVGPDGERSLVVFNNQCQATTGRLAAPFPAEAGDPAAERALELPGFASRVFLNDRLLA